MPAYSYSGDPSSSKTDETRYWLQDVSSPWLCSDEEIAFSLAQNGDRPRRAAAELARAKAAGLIRRGSVAIDGMMINFAERGNALMQLAQNLEAEEYRKGAGALPFAGGVSRDVDTAARQNSDGYNGVMSTLDPPGTEYP